MSHSGPRREKCAKIAVQPPWTNVCIQARQERCELGRAKEWLGRRKEDKLKNGENSGDRRPVVEEEQRAVAILAVPRAEDELVAGGP